MRRLANRSFRQQVGRFLVEGPQAVRDAVLHRPDVVDEIFVVPDVGPKAPDPALHTESPGRSTKGGIVDDAIRAGVRVTEVSEPVLLAMTETVHPQGIAAVARFVHRGLDDVLAGARLVAVLHDVRDPGNAGTILRTAAAAGADAVVFTGESVDPYNGKCVRSTAGCLFSVPFAIESSAMAALEECRREGLTTIAAAGGAVSQITDRRIGDLLEGRIAWIFGNEAHGLPPELRSAAGECVAIPIFGTAESLNLAAAAAVALYTTAFRQRNR